MQLFRFRKSFKWMIMIAMRCLRNNLPQYLHLLDFLEILLLNNHFMMTL